jgi:arabinofuranan 3-O-arabinosyltransferase
VFSRLRVDPTDRWRSDPEPAIARQFDVASDATFDAGVTIRASQRLDDDTLAVLLGEPVRANDHLSGVPAARGAAAFDGDPATSWITSFGSPVGSAVNVRLDGTASSMIVTQPDGTFSPITALRVSDSAGSFDLQVSPAPGASLAFPRPVSLADATFEIIGADERTTLDRRFGETVVLPAAISEITFGTDGGEAPPAVAPVGEITADCSELLSIDGQPVGLSFTATAEQVLHGSPIDAAVCDSIELDAGTHVLESSTALTGFDVDQVVLAQPGVVDAAPAAAPTAALADSSRDSRTVEVSACPTGCWVVLGEGFNTGWPARTESGSLGEPVLVDGNANGWWLEPSTTPTTVTITWASQPFLNGALLASLLGVLAALALAVIDRRRDTDHELVADHPALRPWSTWGGGVVGPGTIVTATIASALLIGWKWGLVALVICVAVRFTHRPRLVAAIGFTLVVAAQLVVVAVVLRERPYPNAGWPVRFEWLHPWSLLGVVLLAAAALFARDSKATDE